MFLDRKVLLFVAFERYTSGHLDIKYLTLEGALTILTMCPHTCIYVTHFFQIIQSQELSLTVLLIPYTSYTFFSELNNSKN